MFKVKSTVTGPDEKKAKPQGAARRSFLARGRWLLGATIPLYLIAAYLLIPLAWRRYAYRSHELLNAPRITHTPNGIPGDPVNVALLGSEADLIHALLAANWHPADPLTIRSSVRIAVDSVLRRPDEQAPVSTLELFGRKQDLAFEQPVGNSPRQRHHVRFWRWDRRYQGMDVWFGAVTFDEQVGFSHTTGQVTHHIAPDLDAERDRLIEGLQRAGVTRRRFLLDGFQQLQGRNGGGDPWHTDGRLVVAEVVAAAGPPAVSAPNLVEPPKQ